MADVTPLNASLTNLARTLRTAFKRNQRNRPRFPVDGSLHILFWANEGAIRSDTVTLKDLFPGGFAFRSARLFCIGNHVCLSDGMEAMEVSIEARREEKEEFVYVVNLGDLNPLPASWRRQLDPTAIRLDAIAAWSQMHGATASDARQ